MSDRVNEELRIGILGEMREAGAAEAHVDELVRRLEDPVSRASADRELSRRHYPYVGRARRARRAIVGALLLIVAGAIASPAAAGAWLARTGDVGTPSTGSTEVDGSEWIDLQATDAQDFIKASYPSYLILPDGLSRDAAIADVSRLFRRLGVESDEGARAQESMIVFTYEDFAMCAWAEEWLDGYAADDSHRTRVAADWLSNPENYPMFVALDGGGVLDAVNRFAAAARTGDVAGVRELREMEGCKSHLAGVAR